MFAFFIDRAWYEGKAEKMKLRILVTIRELEMQAVGKETHLEFNTYVMFNVYDW